MATSMAMATAMVNTKVNTKTLLMHTRRPTRVWFATKTKKQLTSKECETQKALANNTFTYT